MKNEPSVRLGMRISPKMSENPAESRNRSPPSVTLFTASSSHRLIAAFSLAALDRRLLALQRREVARIHRLCQELLLVINKELPDIRIGLDDGVDELAVLALDPADEDIADDIAERVEVEGAARAVRERDGAQCFDHLLLVLGLAAGLLERGLDAHAVDIASRRVAAGDVAVIVDHVLDEPLVGGRVEIARIPRGRDGADRLVAEALE